MSKKKAEIMPYNVDMKILDKILGELKQTNENGMEISKMWTNIGEAKNVNKSYSLNMAIYLRFVEVQGDNIKLTKDRRIINLSSENKRPQILAKNLPEKYMAMYKWVKLSPNHEIQSGDLRVKYFDNYGDVQSQNLLERMISTFMKYMEHIGFATRSGKGQGAKLALTDLGKRVLDLSHDTGDAYGSMRDAPSATTGVMKRMVQDYPALPLVGETIYDESKSTITISFPTRTPFSYEIRAKSDWDVVDSVIDSIKRDWEEKHNTKGKPKPDKVEDLKEGVTEPTNK